jgi:solute carrier family 25 phosphate transporter 23/24/25/41
MLCVLWWRRTNLMRIVPTSGLQFFFFELFKKWFVKEDTAKDNPMVCCKTSGVVLLQRLVAGGCAGLCAGALTYPLDFVRARLTVQVLRAAFALRLAPSGFAI